ncbi:RCC1 domain-containing protein [Senna tora]|uniref:RCC1 domain-containing protein n=1 Tax=Senna tora TaxID=362788 RepID=A0A834TQR1_9FABA|nr:RCC1 domain-containing protein [Senna tora]
MGNCGFKGFSHAHAHALDRTMVKVVTSNGGIMELYAPITVESVTNQFPGHGIFRGATRHHHPMLHSDDLLPGQLYYLLPLHHPSSLATSAATLTPYRMSTYYDSRNSHYKMGSEAEVVPRYNSNNSSGVWKVKLVISPQQLSEILSQDSRTEALIESVRTVAKCGNPAASVANSDQWSVCSSNWKGSMSEKMGLD